MALVVYDGGTLTSLFYRSLACMIFELVTGDYLFDPKEDETGHHTRDEGTKLVSVCL